MTVVCCTLTDKYNKNVATLICLNIYAELLQMNRTWIFQGQGLLLQPQTMLLDESHQRLYVGAKNALFSLNLDRVNAHYRQVRWVLSVSVCLVSKLLGDKSKLDLCVQNFYSHEHVYNAWLNFEGFISYKRYSKTVLCKNSGYMPKYS